jgi:nucleotide-binding universal stress UspA family protein
MFRKILIANDGSTGGFAALRGAIDVAERYSAELHMISAEPIPYLPSTIAEVDVARHERNVAL